MGRPLVLLFLCLSLLLVIAPPAASQGDDVGGELPTQQREWATLDVTVDAKDSLSAEVGRQATIPITITNNGNIAAVGVIAVIEGGDFLVGTPVKVGDLPPGASAAVALPIDIKGRTASPLPITARVAADNVPYPVLVPIAQTFTGLGTGNYLSVALDADLLLEQQYDRYDGGFARPQPLLWFESRDKAAETILTVNLKSLLAGKPPRDLVLSVLFYADGKEIPEPVEAGYDPEQLSLTFAPAGEGRYLIEWSRPMPQTGAAGDGTEGMVESAAAANVEPDLPQGWTPTYHAPLVSEFNGSVTINYPILTPPGAAGLQPNLGLSYSSANGNGMIGRLQADDAGFGWNNVAAIDVTQALVICHGSNVCEAHFDPDGDPDTNNSYNQYTLSFNGAGHELIHAGGIANNGAPGRYYARGHAGLYVELCKAPFSAYCIFSGTNIDTMSDVFWRIKSADNTTYRLGFTTNSEQEIINAAAAGVDNKALRWRVDTITDRFGNTMTYTYDEYTYNGWIHPEYFHASASYPKQITYDAYKVVFTYEEVPYDAYRTQGYGHVVSWQTHRLSQVFVKVAGSPDITVRTYQLGYDFQRYGTDNDTDNLPLDPSIANQSAWCSAFNWVLNFNDPNDKDDNIKYTPDKMPMLRTVRELGSDGNARSGLKDAEFTYSFLGTGEYDHPNASAHVRYCFPYLTSVETLYGPAAANTPTTAYTWRAAQQAFQTAGSLPHLVVGRYVNLVEQETTYSGFVADAPTQNVHFQYTTPNMQGDKDTFQGFNTVERCRDASCSGSWAARETMTFLTNPYYADNAALTGRLQQSDTRGYPNTLIARTENTWSMLEGDGIPGADPSRAAVLMKQIRRDYRGGTIAARTDYVYDLYGNQTQTQEFGERIGTPPWRTLERAYTVNTNVGNDKWLVNLAWRETLWDGPSNGATDKIVRQTRFRYDGAACNAPNTTPTLGRLTAMDAYVPGFGISCGGTDYNTTTYTYDATRKWQVTRVTDAVGRYKDYNWTDATRLGSVTDSVGTTNYAYNTLAIDPGFRWQIRDVTQPNGATTRYSYDVHGRLQQINAPDPATAGAIGAAVKDYNYDDTATPFVIDEIIPVMSSNSTRTFYDAVGRPLQTRQFYVSGDFNTIVTDMEYDSFGRTRCATAALHSTQKVNFDTALDCDAQPKKVYTYDVLGETLSETGYDGTTATTAVVGRERRVTDAAGNQLDRKSVV